MNHICENFQVSTGLSGCLPVQARVGCNHPGTDQAMNPHGLQEVTTDNVQVTQG
jgi:hypothetical protein